MKLTEERESRNQRLAFLSHTDTHTYNMYEITQEASSKSSA